MNKYTQYFQIFNTKVFPYLFLFLIFVFGIYLRLKCLLFNGAFWYTEVELGDCLINSSYPELFKGLEHVQVAPPLFLVVSKFILQIFGAGADIAQRDLILRVFPCFCSILSIPFFMYLVHLVFKNRYITYILSLLFCLNPFAIGYSVVFKQYSTELLISVILLVLFYKIDLKSFSNLKLILWGSVIGLSLWFSLSVYFILCSGYVFLLIKMWREKDFYFKKFLIFLLPILFSFILFIPVLWSVYSKNYYLMNLLWFDTHPMYSNFFNLTEYFDKINELFINDYISPTIEIVSVVCFMIFVTKNGYKNNILFVMPVLLAIFAQMLHHYNFFGRFLLFLIPSFIIVFGAVLKFIDYTKLIRIFIIIFIFFNIGNTIRLYNEDINRLIIDYYPKSREQVMDIRANKKPSDFIITDFRGGDGYVGYYFSDLTNIINVKEIDRIDETGKPVFQDETKVFLNSLRKGKYYFFNPHPSGETLSMFFFENNKYKIIKAYPSGLLYMEKIK